MPSLKWILEEGRPRSFPIYKKITTLGRGVGNDITVEHESVAEFHAQLVFDGRDFGVAVIHGPDVGVNGKGKKKSKIFHNDRLRLGEQEFVFSLYDEAVDKADDEDRAAELAGLSVEAVRASGCADVPDVGRLHCAGSKGKHARLHHPFSIATSSDMVMVPGRRAWLAGFLRDRAEWPALVPRVRRSARSDMRLREHNACGWTRPRGAGRSTPRRRVMCARFWT